MQAGIIQLLYFAGSATWIPWSAWGRVGMVPGHHQCHRNARTSHLRDPPSCPGRHPRQRSTKTFIITDIAYLTATVGNGSWYREVQSASSVSVCFPHHSGVNLGYNGSSEMSYKDRRSPGWLYYRIFFRPTTNKVTWFNSNISIS